MGEFDAVSDQYKVLARVTFNTEELGDSIGGPKGLDMRMIAQCRYEVWSSTTMATTTTQSTSHTRSTSPRTMRSSTIVPTTVCHRRGGWLSADGHQQKKMVLFVFRFWAA